jgi:thiamine kinase-like enzyme
MSTTESHESLAAEIAQALDWPASAVPTLVLLANGATGETFKLSADTVTETYVVRLLKSSESVWSPGYDLVKVTQAVAETGLGAKVVLSTKKFLVVEFCLGKNSTVTGLHSDNVELQAVATATAQLHKLPLDIAPPAGDELQDQWLALVQKKLTNSEDPLLVSLQTELTAGSKYSVYAVTNDVSTTTDNKTSSSSLLEGFKNTVVMTHGDLHMNNLLLDPVSSAAKLIDLDRLAPRRAATDVAYLFHIWSLGYFRTPTVLFTCTTETKPVPYPNLQLRQAFATSYLTELNTDKKTPTSAEVTDFLFQVEVCSYGEWVRLMLIMTVLFGGQPSSNALAGQMLQGLVLPGIHIAGLMRQTLDGLAANDTTETRAELVRNGLKAQATPMAMAEALAGPFLAQWRQ